MTLGQIINHEQMDFTDGGYIAWDDIDWGQDTVRYLQYTGLDDKNRTPVFEGDIITCSSGCPHAIEWTGEVGGTYIGGMPGWYLSEMNQGYAWTGSEEVIGNVIENGDLLNAQD